MQLPSNNTNELTQTNITIYIKGKEIYKFRTINGQSFLPITAVKIRRVTEIIQKNPKTRLVKNADINQQLTFFNTPISYEKLFVNYGILTTDILKSLKTTNCHVLKKKKT